MMRRLLAVLFLMLSAVAASAQIDKGSIEAVALDQSKAPLPGVTVTVTRPETGYQNVVVTDTSGTSCSPVVMQGLLQGRGAPSERARAGRGGTDDGSAGPGDHETRARRSWCLRIPAIPLQKPGSRR